MGEGRPAYFSGSTPKMRWPDGRTQGESMDLVKVGAQHICGQRPSGQPTTPTPPEPSQAVDKAYNTEGVELYPEDVDVDGLVSEFSRCFPSRTRPSSRAAFLFSSGGGPISRAAFEATLEKVCSPERPGRDATHTNRGEAGV